MLGRPKLDKDFDLSSRENQQWLMDFCSDLEKQKFVRSRNSFCWIHDFEDFLTIYGQTLPLDPTAFNSRLIQWAKSNPTGKLLARRNYLGFKKNKLRFFKISFDSKNTFKSNFSQNVELQNQVES